MRGRWYQAWGSAIIGLFASCVAHQLGMDEPSIWTPIIGVAVFTLVEAMRPSPVTVIIVMEPPPKRSHHKRKSATPAPPAPVPPFLQGD